jgi:hypothetical protein
VVHRKVTAIVMKKLNYFFIFSLLAPFTIKAQNKFFPDTFAIWTEYSESLEDPDNQSITEYSYLMQGDTQIDNLTYKVVYTTSHREKRFGIHESPNDYDAKEYYGLTKKVGGVRKDGQKLYYLSFKPAETEQLVYDYGFQTGDSTIIVFGLPRKVLKDTIINGTRVFEIEQFLSPKKLNSRIIEGMGYNSAVLPINPLFGEYVEIKLFCGDGIFYEGIYDNVDFWRTTVTSECKENLSVFLSAAKVANNTFSFFPNPVSNTLTVNNITPGSVITIADVTGKTLETISCSETMVLVNMTNLSQGVYLLQVQSGNTVSVNKIIKE